MEAVPIRSPGALVPLLPRFLMKRRRGNAGLATILAESGLSRPALFMLVRLAQGIEEGETAKELRPGAPYATRDPHLGQLAEVTERGFAVRDEAGRYRLSERGRALMARFERDAATYLAGLRPIREDELARLADRLAGIAAGLETEGRGPGAHLWRGRRVFALAPGWEGAPLVRLERAIYDLWMARDDAHIAAWRAAFFQGPALDLLTRLWQGDIETLDELRETLAGTQAPEDVDTHVAELVEQGYVEWRGGTLQPTRAGYLIREEIEAETDRRYFSQWPPLDPEEVAWLHDALARVIVGLPESPAQD